MSQAKRYIILIAVLGGLALLGFLIGLYIQWSPLKKTTLSLQQGQKQISDLENKARELPALEKQLKEIQAEAEAFKKVLPTAQEVSYDAFWEKFSNQARSLGLNLSSMRLKEQKQSSGAQGNSTASGPLEPATFELTADGSFFDLLQFLYRVETDKRFVRIDELSIAPFTETKGKTEYISFHMLLTLTTYTWKG